MSQIKITCPSCSGCGAVALNRVHLETLELLQDGKTAEDVAATAANNRPEFLWNHDLALRVKNGRSYYYWAARGASIP